MLIAQIAPISCLRSYFIDTDVSEICLLFHELDTINLCNSNQTAIGEISSDYPKNIEWEEYHKNYINFKSKSEVISDVEVDVNRYNKYKICCILMQDWRNETKNCQAKIFN